MIEWHRVTDDAPTQAQLDEQIVIGTGRDDSGYWWTERCNTVQYLRDNFTYWAQINAPAP